MKLPKKITIKEMAPRDGFQNQSKWIPTQEKIQFIEQLIDAGQKYIEITAFVNSKAIPQLKDAKEVAKHFRHEKRAILSALVPNEIGMNAAISSGIKEVAVFTAASETFNQHNIRCSIDESFERFKPIFALAKAHKIKVRGYVSTAFVCPYEGKIASKKTIEVCMRLLKTGCYEVSIGDTIGKASPVEVKALLKNLKSRVPIRRLAMHFHDTYGLAIANVMASLEMGIKTFDTSTGGIGGCPYAPGAKGNVATEDVIALCDALGIHTGLNRDHILKLKKRGHVSKR